MNINTWEVSEITALAFCRLTATSLAIFDKSNLAPSLVFNIASSLPMQILAVGVFGDFRLILRHKFDRLSASMNFPVCSHLQYTSPRAETTRVSIPPDKYEEKSSRSSEKNDLSTNRNKWRNKYCARGARGFATLFLKIVQKNPYGPSELKTIF
jgi:hypothetical protein